MVNLKSPNTTIVRMFAHKSGNLRINAAGNLFFRSLLRCSTTGAAAAAQPQTGSLLEEYLINSLGFSRNEANSASNKVIRRKPIIKKDFDLVVNFFEDLGLNRKTHMKTIVSRNPNLLLCNVDKTLKPKIKFLRELGLVGSDLVKFVIASEHIWLRGLDTYIKPRIELLRQLFGTDDNVVKALKRSVFLLANYELETVEKNVALLRNNGLSDDSIAKLILWFPRPIFISKPEWIQERLDRVENEFRIPRESGTFYYGVGVFCNLNESTIKMKLDLFRSFGWSDGDVRKVVRAFPSILCRSEAKLRKCMEFFTKELGYTPDYLASHHCLFSLSLEKRVKPRNQVLKVLNEKKLNKRRASLHHVVRLTESKFVNDYILPYKDEVPDLCRSYIEGIKLKIEN